MHQFHTIFKARRLPFRCLSVLILTCAFWQGAGAASANTLFDGSFRKPIAGLYEARIATVIQPGNKKLRLDIGMDVDILRITLDSTKPKLMVGVEFMTFTRLRSEHNLKFPVETVDYWFGIRGSYIPAEDVALRLRAAHISAHMVDGLADSNGLFTGRKPFVYSREFIELLAAYHLTPFVQLYAGGTIVTSTQPRTANRLVPQMGLDFEMPINKNFTMRAGYDWRMVGVNDTYVTAQSALAGLQWDSWGAGRGLMLAVNAYNGRSMHGMFFDQADSYVGFGLQVMW